MENNTNGTNPYMNSDNNLQNNISSSAPSSQSNSAYTHYYSNLNQPPSFPNSFSGLSNMQNNKSSKNPFIFGCLFVFIVVILIGILCFGCFFMTSLLGSVSTQNAGVIQSSIYSDIQIQEVPYKSNQQTSNKIVVINIVGAIDYVGPTGDAFSTGTVNDKIILAQIEQAKNDQNVKGVIFRFDSPGGVANVAKPVCDAMKELSKSKLTYSFINGMGASLAYWLPNCSQKIFASPASIIGNIGVRYSVTDFSQALENLGIRVVDITNTEGVHKTQSGALESGSDEYKKYQKILDEAYQEFLNAVYEGRKNNPKVTSKDYVRKYADGSIFSTKEALEIGFIDEIAYSVDDVAQKLASSKQINNYSIIYYDVIGNPWSIFFSQIQSLLPFLNGSRTAVPSSREVVILM